MTFNKQLVDKILKAIIPFPQQFGLSYDPISEEYRCALEKPIAKKIEKLGIPVDVFSGASKLIISPHQENFVIKIPFNGYYYLGLSKNGKDWEEKWEDFKYAPSSNPADYCLAEYEKYEALKERRLEYFVAEMEIYKTFNKFPTYIQEKIIAFNNLIDQPHCTTDSLAIAQEIERCSSTQTFLDPCWIAYSIDRYGIDKVHQFIKYCKDQDKDILEDAHESNYGYRVTDMTPAFLDYSNYLE